MPVINGMVFDKDGTLFDFNATWGAWTMGMLEELSKGSPDLMGQLADKLGYDLENRKFRQGSIVIAETTAVVAEHILPLLPGRDRDSLVVEMKAMSKVVPQIEATPLRPLFAELKRRGIKIGVATNDAHEPAVSHLERADVTDLVDFVAGFDSGYGGKPAPGQLDAFSDQTGVAAANCLMIGDSMHDMHAGRAAGMITVGVLTGPATAEELASGADVILGSIAELPDWLDRNPGQD